MDGKVCERPASYRRYVENGLTEADEDMKKALGVSSRCIGRWFVLSGAWRREFPDAGTGRSETGVRRNPVPPDSMSCLLVGMIFSRHSCRRLSIGFRRAARQAG